MDYYGTNTGSITAVDPLASDACDVGGDGLAQAVVDWQETQDTHIFQANVPGLRKEELKVQLEDGNVVQICGEQTREEQVGDDSWQRVERSRGSFTRRFRLPENAKLDEIRCDLNNSILTVTVPKKESAPHPTQPNVRSVEVA